MRKKGLDQYKKGFFSSLDIELGGGCNFQCIYCDSPQYGKECQLPMADVKKLLSDRLVQWIYICGLGEPTFYNNYSRLVEILESCVQYGVRCSIFSNLSNLTPELERYICDGFLHIIFKFDTREPALVKALYGARAPEEQLDNIKKIKALVKSNGYTTNLAASIVPTRLNIHSILPVVEECLESNIYPLLGELECSGMGQVNYTELCLHPEEALELKSNVESLMGESYEIPVCPSVISGVHIDYSGYVTVDKTTGLSCNWFWLEEPKTNRLKHCSSYENLEMITKEVIDYRGRCIENVRTFLERGKHVGMAFGGCGGDVTKLFKQYVKIHRSEGHALP